MTVELTVGGGAVAVVGPGALGLIVAAKLRLAGLEVGVVGQQPGQGQAAYLSLDPAATALHLEEFPAADLGRVAIIFLAVKAFDLAPALTMVAAQAAGGASVIPIGNGAVEGMILAAAAAHQDLHWRLGVATLGISALAPGREARGQPVPSYALRSTTGSVVFGPGPSAAAAPAAADQLPTVAEQHLLSRVAAAAASSTSSAAPWLRWEEHALAAARRKWLFNTVINSLTADLGLARNGDLLAHRSQLEAVFAEAYALGGERFGLWSETRAELLSQLLALVAAAAANENSMARDFRLGRPTESAFLAGLAGGDRRFPLLCALHERLGVTRRPGRAPA